MAGDRVEALREGRVLMVASTGGHLSQLIRLTRLNSWSADRSWITFDSPQSQALLEDEDVDYVPYIAPRDWRRVISAWPKAWKILRSRRPTAVVSTGAAAALAVFPVALVLRIPRYYVESVARTDGPSVTGRIVRWLPGTRTFTQHANWGLKRWRPAMSVLDSWQGEVADPTDVSRIFVTLGTIRPYRFDALIDSVKESLPEGTTVTWQLGMTLRDDLPGQVKETMTAHEFAEEVSAADVVITHAGAGTVLHLLEERKAFVLVPRRVARNEHIDDHQLGIAGVVAERKLAPVVEADELTWSDVQDATRIRVSDTAAA